jgi:hypothetical protein
VTVHAGWRRRRLALALVVALLAAAACGDDDDGETEVTDASEDGGDAADGSELTVAITDPATDDEVDGSFTVELDSSVPLDVPDSGAHHVHLVYDGDENDVDMAFEESFIVERDLGSGEHTIGAVLVNPDHSPTEARDEVSVTVAGDGGSGGNGNGDGGGDDGYSPG